MSKLQAGDILVFKAGDDWVGKTIAWLTDSDVSHAAMMLNDKMMIEMGAGGVCAGNVEVLGGDSAIVLRLHPQKDPVPLVGVAQKYIDSETRYDIPATVFLAGLMISRKISPTPKLVVLMETILRTACMQLDRVTQLIILKNPHKAMVCFQLVYQIYNDCGKEYQIKIGGELVQAGSNLDTDGGVCLADLAQSAPELDMANFTDASMPDTEELAKELYHALTAQKTETGINFTTADFGTLPSYTKCFLETLEKLLEKSKSNLPMDALFIPPSDLAYKSKNLNTVGKVDIVR